MGKRIALAVLVMFSFVFWGCPPAVTDQDEGTGSLVLSMSSATSNPRTLVPPQDMDVALWDIHGAGPDGAAFDLPGVVGATVARNGLRPGAWLLTVDGKNATGTRIGTGAATATVTAGGTAHVPVTVAPLAGYGSLVLTVSWPAGLLLSPAVSGTLGPAGGSANDIFFSLSPDNLSATFTNSSLAAGYYSLTVQLTDGSVKTWGARVSVRIVTGAETSGAFMLTESDIDAVGSLEVQLTPALDPPVEIVLSGQVPVLDWGKSMTVTATPSTSVDTYQWYLNGSILAGETGSSVTLGSSLVRGNYRLDLEVRKGAVLSSASTSFQVKPLTISAMLSQISESEMYNTVYDLQVMPNRQYGSPGNFQAGTYLFNRLSAIPGLLVEYQGGDYRNVIATLPSGAGEGDEIYMVGAHYDAIVNSPGALDNGCGVAILLEVARVMSQHSYQHTLKFACWNDEEGGQNGSSTYAQSAYASSMNLRLYMNFDSAAYDPGSQSMIDIMYRENSKWASDLMTLNNTLYGINFTVTYNVHYNTCGSDQNAFWNYGFAGVMTHSEHGPTIAPDDSADAMSKPYAKKNGQLIMSVLAEKAQLK